MAPSRDATVDQAGATTPSEGGPRGRPASAMGAGVPAEPEGGVPAPPTSPAQDPRAHPVVARRREGSSRGFPLEPLGCLWRGWRRVSEAHPGREAYVAPRAPARAVGCGSRRVLAVPGVFPWCPPPAEPPVAGWVRDREPARYPGRASRRVPVGPGRPLGACGMAAPLPGCLRGGCRAGRSGGGPREPRFRFGCPRGHPRHRADRERACPFCTHETDNCPMPPVWVNQRCP